MELSKMNYDDALDFMSNSQDAKLEHLLRFDVFYIKDSQRLLDWIPTLTDTMWNCYGITLAYTGFSTHEIHDKTEFAELFFRSDRVITEDEFTDIHECMEILDEGPTFLGVSHKTMLCDDLCDIFEDIAYHWSIDSYQDLYGFTNEEMFDIFGKDAGLFGSQK